MLSLDFVKANHATVERAIRDKGVELNLQALLNLSEIVRKMKTRLDELRAERNSISARFKDAEPSIKPELGKAAKDLGRQAGELEANLALRDAELRELLLKLPNIPFDGAPVGPDESFNQVIRTVGEPRHFDFEPLDHVALIEKNGWGDLNRVTQVSGSRTYCLKGALALLETKLMAWALD
jgi:seryl-tRNA synthetase